MFSGINMKASDIDDAVMLLVVDEVDNPDTCGAMVWDIEKKFADTPSKVVRAKLKQLLKRDLLDGCPRGCRGDWRLTQKGDALLLSLS